MGVGGGDDLAPDDTRAVPVLTVALLDHLDRGREAVVSGLVDCVRRTVPEYGGVTSPAVQAAVADAIGRVYAIGTSVLRGARPLSAEEGIVLRDIGREHARQGFPLPSLTRSFRVAVSEVWGRLQALARGIPPSVAKDDALAYVTTTLLSLMDEACGHLETGHAEEARSRRTRDQRLLAFVEDLLNGGFDTVDAMRRAARDIAYPFTDEQGLVLLTTAAPRRVVLEELRGAAVGFLAGRPCGAYMAGAVPDNAHVALVIPVQPHHSWETVIGELRQLVVERGLTAVIHCPVPAPALAAAYASFRPLLDKARCVFPRQIASWQHVQPLRVLTQDREQLQTFADDHLGRLLEQPERIAVPLLDTLHDLYTGGGPDSRTALAARLHLNRDTVAQRLRQIQLLTGLDPAGTGRTTLQLAYYAHLIGRA